MAAKQQSYKHGKNIELKNQKGLEIHRLKKTESRNQEADKPEKKSSNFMENIKEFLHIIGLSKRAEEKQKEELQEEAEMEQKLLQELKIYKEPEKKSAKRNQAKLKLKKQLASKKKKEKARKKRLLKLKKRHQKLWLKQKKAELRKKEQERKKQERELKRQKKSEEKIIAEAEKKKIDVETKPEETKEEAQPQVQTQKKPSWLKRFFKKEKEEQELEELEEKPPQEKKLFVRLIKETEEKPKREPKKSLDEFEELEQSIKDLGLFKKLEKVPLQSGEEAKEVIKQHAREQKIAKIKHGIFNIFSRKPKKEEPDAEMGVEEKTFKSKNLKKIYDLMNESKEYIGKNNIQKAKKFYVEARNIYIGLEKEEKKEIYYELLELYNRLNQ